MATLGFRRYAVFVTLSVLTLIAFGAYIVSQANAPQQSPPGLLNANLHRQIGIAVCVMAFGLALWELKTGQESSLSWIALILVAAEAWMGWIGARLLHATLAPLAFASLAAAIVVSAPGWNKSPEPVVDVPSKRLRRLAVAAPPFVLLQTMLGATYRHKVTGFIPHLAGAAIVTLITLMAATQVLESYPNHRALRSAARWLVAVVLVQVTLGATSFGMQLFDVRNPMLVVASTALHVVIGSVTLAASVRQYAS